MNLTNIYIDCDEVLLDTARTIADFLHEQYNITVDKNKYPSDWKLPDDLHTNCQGIVAEFAKTDRFSDIPIMPNAKEGVFALKNIGYFLSIISSISQDAEALKKREQNIHKLFGSDVFTSITCYPLGLDNKGKYYSSVPKGIVIDDALYNLLTAQKYGHEVILMATKQNAHMQQEAKKRHITIHQSLVNVAQFLHDRQRSFST